MPIKISDTVKKLLIAYVAVFVLQKGMDNYAGGNVLGIFALTPLAVLHGQIWQLFTYSFLHADVMHLIFNLMVFVFVASDLEAIWGRNKFLTYYFYCTTMAGFFYMVMQLLINNPMYLSLPMLGASGGIYGLLLAYGLLFPDREMLFMMMFPLKAKQFVWLLGGIEFLVAFSSGQSGLGSFAHLSGMGAGFLYLWFQAKGFQLRKNNQAAKRKKSSGHLRLVKTEDEDKPPKTWH